jgi:phage-related protein
MAFPKVGLEAVMDDADFNKGVSNYLKGSDQMVDKSGKTGSALGGLGKAIGVLGGIIGGVFAVAKVVDFFKQSVALAAEEEQGIVKLGAAVKNTGADWDVASAAIETYLAAQLKRTGLDDGEGRSAIQKLTEATGDYGKALDLMGITQDLARAKGMDLAGAAELVGKVSQGNVGILGRYGIVLGKGATATEALAAMQARFGGQAEAFGNTYAGAMQKWQVASGNLRETIGAALLPMLGSLANSLVDIAQRAMPWITTAATNLQTMLGGITTAVGPALQGIAAPFAAIIAAVQAGQSPLLILQNTFPAIFSPAVTAAIVAIANPIERLFGSIVAGQSPLMALSLAWPKVFSPEIVANIVAIERGIETTFGIIVSTIGGALATVWETWQTIWPSLLTVLLPVWTRITEVVGTAVRAVGSIVQAMGGLFTQVMGILGPAIAQAMVVIGPILNTIGAKFQEIFGEIGPLVVGVIGTISAWINENMPLIQQTITTVLAAISTVWNTVWPYLSAVISEVWENVKLIVTTAINVVLAVIKAVMQAINGDWDGAWKTIVGALEVWWKAIVQNIENKLNLILGFFGTNLSKIGETIKTWASDTYETFTTWVDDTATAIADFFVTLPGKVYDWIMAVPAEIAKAVPKLVAAAGDMIQGFWDGLVSKWNQVKAWIGDTFANVLPAWVMQLLGISSPSTVFMEIGLATMQGFAEGMDEGEAEVLSGVASLIEDIVRAFEAVAGMGGTELGAFPDMKEWGNRLVIVIETFSAAILWARDHVGTVALEAAAALSETVGAILALASTNLTGLANAATFPDMDAWGNRLVIVIQTLSAAILWARDKIGTEALTAASELADTIGKIVGLATLNFGGLALAETFPDMDEWGNRLVIVIETITAALLWVKAKLGDAALTAAAAASDTIGKIVGFLKPAIDALDALTKYEPVEHLDWRMTWLGDQIIYVADSLVATWGRFKISAVESAEKLGAAMASIRDAIKAGLATLGVLGDAGAGTAIGAVATFAEALDAYLRQAIQIVEARLREIAMAIRSATPLAYTAGYGYGQAIARGINAGLASTPMGQLPGPRDVGGSRVFAPAYGGARAGAVTTNHVSLGGLNFAGGVSNGMDLQRVGDYVVQRVREGLRR